LFLLPMAAIIVWTSWPFFVTSFLQNEQSPNYGGLPQWPAKFLIPLAFTILFVQGLSELIKRIAIMRGELAEPEHEMSHPAAELAQPRDAMDAKSADNGDDPRGTAPDEVR
jgi:TRAP-type mannitol/chloroaromatic compound transport system permease small subunit